MNEAIEFMRNFSSMVGAQTGASDSLLHVHGGMIVLFLARVVTRRSLASWTPFLVVLAAGLLKELLDYWLHGYVKPDSATDVLNTILWPFVLMGGLRWRQARN